MVTCHARISYRVNKRSAADPIAKVDWKTLTTNPELKYQYSVKVVNRYNALLDESSQDHDYCLLVKSVTDAALETLPKKKPRSKQNPYNSPGISQKHDILQKSALIHRTSLSFETKDAVEAAKKSLTMPMLQLPQIM